jgi:hypothetical protein
MHRASACSTGRQSTGRKRTASACSKYPVPSASNWQCCRTCREPMAEFVELEDFLKRSNWNLIDLVPLL